MEEKSGTGDTRKDRKVLASRREMTILVAIGVVVCLVLLAFGMGLFAQRSGHDGTYTHTYEVRILTNSTSEYTLLLAIPRNATGDIPATFISDLEYDGSKIAAVLNSSEHGLALKIVGSGSTNLSWSDEWRVTERDRFGNMTMTSGAEGWTHREGPAVTWLYCSVSGVQVSLFYESINKYHVSPWFVSGGGPIFSLYNHITAEGWQQPQIDYGWMVIN